MTFDGGSKDTFDLVIAVDGPTSKTRSLILDEQILKDSYSFLGQYVAFFNIPSRPTDSKLWQIYNVPKGLCITTRPHRNTSTTGAYLCINASTWPTGLSRRGTDDAKRMLHNTLKMQVGKQSGY